MENKWRSTIVFAASFPFLMALIFVINYLTFSSGIINILLAVYQLNNKDGGPEVKLLGTGNSILVSILNITYL